MEVMVKPGKALVILPGSAQDSGSYREACEALGLRPSPHGQAIYLAETSAGSFTLVSAELGESHAIQHAKVRHADRAGSRHTGEQHHGPAVVRGNRRSTPVAEVVEIGLDSNPIARVIVEPSGMRDGVTAEAHPVAKPEGGAKAEGRVEAAVREAVAEVLAKPRSTA